MEVGLVFAVSLRQPVADLLVLGVMDAFEGYGRTRMSGRIAIHAGLGTDEAGWLTELWARAPEQGAIAAERANELAACGHPPGAHKEGCERCQRFGALVGSVKLVARHVAGSCGGCSPWVDPTKAHWRVTDAEQWPPRAAKGEPQPFPVEPPDS